MSKVITGSVGREAGRKECVEADRQRKGETVRVSETGGSGKGKG